MLKFQFNQGGEVNANIDEKLDKGQEIEQQCAYVSNADKYNRIYMNRFSRNSMTVISRKLNKPVQLEIRAAD